MMGKNWLLWTGVIMVYYIINFVMAVGACNFYSDVTHDSPCMSENKIVKSGDDASMVMDPAIKLCGIFHIIEWIRTTVLLTVVLIGSPLMIVWYVSGVSFLYGIVAFIYMHTVAF